MRLPLLALCIALGACARGPALLRRDDSADEALYRRAVHYLDPANDRASLDSARLLLDRYLASSRQKDRAREAIVMRRLIDEAQELERVEFALHQQLASAPSQPTDSAKREPDVRRTQAKQGDPPHPRRSAEAAREIQRLREELREANAELERIRKRLAAPKP
jgi:hypothetical protein